MRNLKSGAKSEAAKIALPQKFAPQLATLVDKPPEGDNWVHEIKFDGYRILAFLDRGKVTLLTRNGINWTDKFSPVAKALERLKVDSAIIDGEVVVLDAEGRSDFQALQAMLKNLEKVEPTYYAFDLPFFDGRSLVSDPLLDRKKKLESILKRPAIGSRVAFSTHVVGRGDELLSKACEMSLEGIISKRADAPYVGRRDVTWLKSKCQQRQEFVIIGFTDPEGGRTGFGSLLLGFHDAEHRLTYAGRVGTGFNDKLLTSLHKELLTLERKESPTDLPTPAREKRSAHWVKPILVCEVRFTGWTRDGMLRHPAFIALRSDKKASQIVREIPASVNAVTTASAAPSKKARSEKGKKPPKVEISNKSGAAEAHVSGVRLSHPDKLLFPKEKISKLDVANYYVIAAESMMPHLIERPLALVRCPAGQSSKCFFQRNWSNTLPKEIGKIDVSETKSKHDFHIAVSKTPGIISLVQLGVLEFHTWNCTAMDIEHPDQLVFDLDPGPGVSWKQVIEGAGLVRKVLEALNLPTFVKTSGGKGVHITVPITPHIDWDSAKTFCKTVAGALVQQSDLFVDNMRKDLRAKKIYIDYNRNGRGATAVAPYSTRAREGAPVSMPVSWKELGRLSSAAHFTVRSAPAYLQKRAVDPWKDFDKARVDLLKVIGKQ